MTRTTIGVSPDGSGKRIALDRVDDAGTLSDRQIIRVAGDLPEELQAVTNAPPAADAYGAAVRVVGGLAVDVSELATEATALLELAKLTAIADNTDGLEGYVDTLEALVTTLNGFVDGLEAALATLNAKAFLTDAELRASPVPVSGTVGVTGVATETTLAAIAASVDGLEGFTNDLETLSAAMSVLVDGLEGSSGTAADEASAVDGPGSMQAKLRLLTIQLNAIYLELVSVGGNVDGIETALATLNAKAFLTDTELRASPVPVSGTVAVTGSATEATLASILSSVDGLEGLATTLNGLVDGLEAAFATLNAKAFLTNAELRASAVPVSGTVAVTGVATESTLNAIGALIVTIQGYVDGIETALATLNGKDFATQATLATLSATATTISGNVDGIEAALTTIQGYIDTLEAVFGTSADASSVTGSVHAKLRAIASSVAAATPAGTNNIGDVDVLTTVTPANRSAAGSLASGGAVHMFPCIGVGTVGLEVYGTWSGTIVIQAIGDAFTIGPTLPAIFDVATGCNIQTITANGLYLIPAAGHAQVRAVMATYTSGTVNLAWIGSPGSSSPAMGQSLAGVLDGLAVAVDFRPLGVGSATVEITGTWVGQVNFQSFGPAFTTTFTNLGVSMATGLLQSSTTTNGLFLFPAAGISGLRVIMSPYTSGSAIIKWLGSPGTSAVVLANPIPISQSAVATAYSVAASVTSVELRPIVVTRKSLAVRNDSASADLYLGLGTAATTVMPVKLPAGAFYELPAPIYPGQINGIWSAAVGNARIMEQT